MKCSLAVAIAMLTGLALSGCAGEEGANTTEEVAPARQALVEGVTVNLDWVMAPHFPGTESLPAPTAADAASASCTPGTSGGCGLWCGSTGVHVCNPDGRWSNCVGVEFCNGLDDNCDGVGDEGGVCQVPKSLLSVGVEPNYRPGPLTKGAPPLPTTHCEPSADEIRVLGANVGCTPQGQCAVFGYSPVSGTQFVIRQCPVVTPDCWGAPGSCDAQSKSVALSSCNGTVETDGVCRSGNHAWITPYALTSLSSSSAQPQNTLVPSWDGPNGPAQATPCVMPTGAPGWSFPGGGCFAQSNFPECQAGQQRACYLDGGGSGTTTCNSSTQKWNPCQGPPAPIAASGFDTKLTACKSELGGRTVAQYEWQVHSLTYGVNAQFFTLSCDADFVFKSEGAYRTSVIIHFTNGEKAGLDREVRIRNKVIVSLGDSIASGEGVPHDEKTATSSATWVDKRCHRSLLSWHAQASRNIETMSPHDSVTFLSLACSGASTKHLLDTEYAGQEPDPTLLRAEPPQLLEAGRILSAYPNRRVDALLLQIGANDIKFSDTIKSCAQAYKAGQFLAPGVTTPGCQVKYGSSYPANWQSSTVAQDLKSALSRVAAQIQQPFANGGLNAPSNVYIAEYPDLSNYAAGYQDMVFAGAFDDAVGPLSWLTFPAEILSFGKQNHADAAISANDAQWAHERVLPLLNGVVNSTTEFGWQVVAGVNAQHEFGRHGYAAADHWFVQYAESKARQGNDSGTVHPNLLGHDNYRRHLQPLLARDLLSRKGGSDANGDGFSDIVLSSGWWWGSVPLIRSVGNGEFTPINPSAPEFAQWAESATPISGDFDGDRRADIALIGVPSWTTIPIAFTKADSTYAITNLSNGEFTSYAAVAGTQPVVGDFNGDRVDDIALMGGGYWNTLPVAFSTRGGTFSVTNNPLADFPTWAAAPNVKAVGGDFNGDGRSDIALVGGPGWATIPVAFSAGNGNFFVSNQPVADFPGFAQHDGAKPVSGDFNGDGLADIALVGGPGWATQPVAFGDGLGNFTVTNSPIVEFADWARVPGVRPAAGDFNADGFADIALVGGPGWNTVPVAYGVPSAPGTFRVTNQPVAEFPQWAEHGGAKPAQSF